MRLTPRQRVSNALLGKDLDKVPFTVYEGLLLRSTAERELRNMGLCVVDRTIPVLKMHRPDVQWRHTQYRDEGRHFSRTEYQTPFGDVFELKENTLTSSWPVKHLFSTPEDYRRLAFMVDNESYEPVYQNLVDAQKRAGNDIIFRAGVGLEPLQQIIVAFMGTETFCVEWMERRDEIMKLYSVLVNAARRRYRLLAASPAWIFNYGGNVVPELIGPKTFEELYLPHYLEASEILHAHGKLIGCHFDANCKVFSSIINRSGLDYIEAFTPAPETDMTVADAVKAWPDKCLWINFPSSHFLQSPDDIAQHTIEYLESAKEHRKFIIGITETVPLDAWQVGFRTIMQTISNFGSVK